jgi:hypothetical protein
MTNTAPAIKTPRKNPISKNTMTPRIVRTLWRSHFFNSRIHHEMKHSLGGAAAGFLTMRSPGGKF